MSGGARATPPAPGGEGKLTDTPECTITNGQDQKATIPEAMYECEGEYFWNVLSEEAHPESEPGYFLPINLRQATAAPPRTAAVPGPGTGAPDASSGWE